MTDDIDHYDLLLRSMEEGLLIGVNRDAPNRPGTDELRVVNSADRKTEVLLKRGHEDFVTIKRTQSGDLVLHDCEGFGNSETREVVTLEVLGIGTDAPEVSDTHPDAIDKTLADLAEERRAQGRPSIVAVEETFRRAYNSKHIAERVAEAVTSDEGEIVSMDATSSVDEDDFDELPEGSTLILNDLGKPGVRAEMYPVVESLTRQHQINVAIRKVDVPSWLLRNADAFATGYDGDRAVFECEYDPVEKTVLQKRLDGFEATEENDE